MVENGQLRLVIRTPLATVFSEMVRGLRVSTGSGWVGIRPRAERMQLSIEPGLLIIQQSKGVRYVATAGGLLSSGRRQADLYTPFAAHGETPEATLSALTEVLSTPPPELRARWQLGELERRIVGELRRGRAAGAGGHG